MIFSVLLFATQEIPSGVVVKEDFGVNPNILVIGDCGLKSTVAPEHWQTLGPAIMTFPKGRLSVMVNPEAPPLECQYPRKILDMPVTTADMYPRYTLRDGTISLHPNQSDHIVTDITAESFSCGGYTAFLLENLSGPFIPNFIKKFSQTGQCGATACIQFMFDIDPEASEVAKQKAESEVFIGLSMKNPFADCFDAAYLQYKENPNKKDLASKRFESAFFAAQNFISQHCSEYGISKSTLKKSGFPIAKGKNKSTDIDTLWSCKDTHVSSAFRQVFLYFYRKEEIMNCVKSFGNLSVNKFFRAFPSDSLAGYRNVYNLFIQKTDAVEES